MNLSDTASMAALMVQEQSKQIRWMSAEEYLKNKMGSGADGEKHIYNNT